MGKMMVTKKEVLEAVAKENLMPNHFVRHLRDGMPTDAATKNQCVVCAIGAVVRRKTRGIQSISVVQLDQRAASAVNPDFAFANEGLAHAKALIKTVPWNALSVAFETIASDVRLKEDDEVGSKEYEKKLAKVRKKLTAWVEANFPKKVELVLL